MAATNNSTNRGFAGLESLISDGTSAGPLPAACREPASPASTPSSPSIGSPKRADPQLKPDRDRGNLWPVLILGGIGVAIVISVSTNDDHARQTGASAPIAASSPTQRYTRPAPESAVIVESMPAPGSDAVLSVNEIAYCLLQKERLDGLESAANKAVHREVVAFNSMVEDFNGRCSSYRYRDTDMARAQTYTSIQAAAVKQQVAEILANWRHHRTSLRIDPSAPHSFASSRTRPQSGNSGRYSSNAGSAEGELDSFESEDYPKDKGRKPWQQS